MQKTLDRIYLPSQDKIVEGLSKFNEEDQHNLLQGQEQSIELSKALQKDENAINTISAVASGHQIQNTTLADQNQWAQEVRRADERCVEYQNMLTELQAKLG